MKYLAQSHMALKWSQNLNPSSLTLQPMLLTTHLEVLQNLQETQKRMSEDKSLNPHSITHGVLLGNWTDSYH